MKGSIIKTADEVFCRRKKNIITRGLRSWKQNVTHLTAEKWEAYLKFLQTETEADHIKCRMIRAMVKIKRNKENKYKQLTYI
jgi:hypothetical protein